MNQPIDVIVADLDDQRHAAAITELIDAYAADPMGRGKGLAKEVLRDLVPGLRDHPLALAMLAFDAQEAVGVAVCFVGYSTFAARPLLNIHDLAVKSAARGRGVGRALLAAIEAKARALGCCKVTLEVRADNHVAKNLYRNIGFETGESPEGGAAMLFWTKLLS